MFSAVFAVAASFGSGVDDFVAFEDDYRRAFKTLWRRCWDCATSAAIVQVSEAKGVKEVQTTAYDWSGVPACYRTEVRGSGLPWGSIHNSYYRSEFRQNVDKSWAIAQVEANRDGRDWIQALHYPSVFYPTYFDGDPIMEMLFVKSPQVKIAAFERTADGAVHRTTVRLERQIVHGNSASTMKFEVVLRDDLDFALETLHAFHPSVGTMPKRAIACRYSDGSDGLPRHLVEATDVQRFEGGKDFIDKKITVTAWRPSTDLAPSDFRLSALGLPEPAVGGRKPASAWPWWPFLAGGGIAALLAAGWLARRGAGLRGGNRGFSLIELLVVIGLMSILMSLLMPAASSVREAARRALCGARLRELGVALAQYHDSFACLPPGTLRSTDPRLPRQYDPCTATGNGFSANWRLLPWLEQAAFFEATNGVLATSSAENETVARASVAAFTCPADAPGLNKGWTSELGRDRSAARGNYVFCHGSIPTVAWPAFYSNCAVPALAIAQSNGCFNELAPLRFRDVVDGLGHTMFASETAFGLLMNDADADLHPQNFRGRWISGNWGNTRFLATFPPNPWNVSDRLNGIAWTHSASSNHPEGVNVLFGDGAVSFVGEAVDSTPIDPATGWPVGAVPNGLLHFQVEPERGVWQRWATRNGRESF